MKIQKQKGLTLIGFIVVLAVVLFISYIGMKIGPIYMENYSVLTAMKGIAGEKGSARLSPYDIKLKFFTRMNIDDINHLTEANVKLTRGNGINMRVMYDRRENIMGNLDVIVTFNETVRMSD